MPRADAGRSGRPTGLGDVSCFIFSAGMLRHFKFKAPCSSLFMISQIMCHMGKLISKQTYIFKKQPFIEVFKREIGGRKGMNWLSLILILGGLITYSTFMSFFQEYYLLRLLHGIIVHHSYFIGGPCRRSR